MFDLGAGAGTGAGKPAAKSAATAERKVLTAANRLQFEKELLGFYVSGHPMNAYEGLAEALNTYAIDELLQQGDRVEFRLCGIAGNIVKRLSKKDNRPWAMFTLATKQGSIGLNIFADGYEAYGRSLQENATVLVQGNIIVNQEGPRINVKEIYPLDGQIAGLVRKVTWLLQPAHPGVPDFLRALRETLNRQAGDTKVQLGFVFERRIAPIAETSNALSWKLNAPAFQQLRAHPAVAGVQIETRPVELKEDRRWKKRA
jgi:DNA polymerase-3 subunit alpha